jgi:hypothetical protein
VWILFESATLLEKTTSGTLLEKAISGTLLEKTISGTLLEKTISGTLLEKTTSGASWLVLSTPMMKAFAVPVVSFTFVSSKTGAPASPTFFLIKLNPVRQLSTFSTCTSAACLSDLLLKGIIHREKARELKIYANVTKSSGTAPSTPFCYSTLFSH